LFWCSHWLIWVENAFESVMWVMRIVLLTIHQTTMMKIVLSFMKVTKVFLSTSWMKKLSILCTITLYILLHGFLVAIWFHWILNLYLYMGLTGLKITCGCINGFYSWLNLLVSTWISLSFMRAFCSYLPGFESRHKWFYSI